MRLRVAACTVVAVCLIGLLLVERYLSHTAPEPRATARDMQPRLACSASAPWSLRLVRARCGLSRSLRCFNGYDALSGRRGERNRWNAFTLLSPVLDAAGFERDCLGTNRTRSESQRWGARVEERAMRKAGGRRPAVIFAPNYWSPGAPDWRSWRLLPHQRINRWVRTQHRPSSSAPIRPIRWVDATTILQITILTYPHS